MSHYYYECFDCGQIYQSDVVENRGIYLCELCGTAKKNEPLKGVLTIKYEYNLLKEIYTKEKILNFKPGTITHLRPLLPLKLKTKIAEIKTDKNLDKYIALNDNSLFQIQINNDFQFVLDETRNFTFSYKDRASILVILKALELGITEIACASTGNAGSSLAGLAAKLGIKAHIFVPKNIPNEKRIQIEAYGAKLHIVNGDYDLAFDLCLEESYKHNWYNRNTAFNSLTIEGKKNAAFDIYIQTKGNVPKYIIVPVGDGVIISGLYKGFWELKQLGLIKTLPKLIAIQAKGSDALVRFIKNGKFKYKAASTIADSISAGAPRNLYMAADAINKTKGTAISVTDSQILKAQKQLAKNNGILAEPSSAASLAGYLKLKKELKIKPNTALLLITGNGLKDISSFSKTK